MTEAQTAGTTTDRVELRVPADPAYLAVLRTATAGLAARLDLTLDEIEDLRIAVDEACALVLGPQPLDGSNDPTSTHAPEDTGSPATGLTATGPTATGPTANGQTLLATFDLDPTGLSVEVSGPARRLPGKESFAWAVLEALVGSLEVGFDDEDGTRSACATAAPGGDVTSEADGDPAPGSAPAPGTQSEPELVPVPALDSVPDLDSVPGARAGSSADLVALAKLVPGDPARPALRDKVVEAHLPLVRHLARRYADRGEPLDDLVQVGTIGLLKAVDRYEPDRGVPFAAFAVPTVLGEIRRHFRDRGWAVRVPRRLQELSRTLADARTELTQELGRAPTVGELAERAQVDEDAVLEGMESAGAYTTVPLDPAETDAPLTWLATDDEGLRGVEDREALRPLLARLPARERRIIALRFVRGMSQAQIAEEVGISQMHVSRLLARTLAALRAELGDDTGPV